MLTDIRSRLISSYLLVIGALIVAFIALLVVMRPLQIALTKARLALELRQLRDYVLQLPAQERSPRILPRLLAEQNFQGRMLIINPGHDHTIIFDSDDAWSGETFPFNDNPQRRTWGGTIIGPGNAGLVYVATSAHLPNSNDPSGLRVVLVMPQPSTLGDVIAEFGWRFLIAGFVAFFISIVLSLLIARSIANPLRAIAGAAEAVAQGDYSQQVAETGPDEVKQVALSFNRMTQEVQAGQSAMQNFVSNASHELKTPLTSIQGFSQALRDGEVQGKADRKRYAGIIFDEANRMRRLVEDLLDLARIDAGQIVIGKRPIDLSALLDLILDSLSAQVSAKKLTIRKDYRQLPNVVGDGDRLIQVFTNLIDNAIKHTPTEGIITIRGVLEAKPGLNGSGQNAISSKKGKSFARVSIADTGPGIEPEDLKRIFERLYQVDRSRKRGRGMGLGLAIAHDIVQAHGGHMRVKSILGRGTQFAVWLPTKEADVTTLISKRK